MASPEGHTMPENDEIQLRQMCGQGKPKAGQEPAELDPTLEAKYWELKRCADRGGVQLRPHDLMWLAMLRGYGKQPTAKEAAPLNAQQLFQGKKLQFGDDVDTIWRGTPVTGKWQGPTPDGRQCKVLIDGEERLIDSDKVFLPQQQAA